MLETSIILARFWGGLFLSLGLMSIGGNFLGKVIKMSEERAITVSTGYITFLLGLVTVVMHNIWTTEWFVVITVLGWVTLLKGVMKMGFPEHVSKKAQMFKKHVIIWSVVILLMGVGLIWMSFNTG
jgi:hypothetical protein